MHAKNDARGKNSKIEKGIPAVRKYELSYIF